MSDSTNVALDSAFDKSIDRVLGGEDIGETAIDREVLRAARFVARAVEDLAPTPLSRERALRTIPERAQRSAAPSWLDILSVRAPRVAWRAVPIAVLAVAALVGAAYAIPVVLPDGFTIFHPAAVDILESGRARDLKLSQTVAGVTITADRAYADAQRIVIQFTVQNPPADPAQTVPAPLHSGGSVTLRDDAGRTYPIIRGVESPFIENARWTGQPLVGVYSFDGSQIAAGAERVSLELTIADLHGTGAGSVARVAGPWTFVFDLPVSR